MMALSTLLALFAGIAALLALLMRANRSAKTVRLPPGPRALPIVGNMFQMPKQWAWLRFTEWSKEYGPIYSLSVPGSRLIVLNSFEHISENMAMVQFSDRPKYTVAGELMGFDQSMLLLNEGPELRLHKRLIHTSLNPSAVRNFAEVQREAIHRCIVRLGHASGGTFAKEIRLAIVRSIVQMTYGFKVDTLEDPFVTAAEYPSLALGLALAPGRFLADTFPLLKYVPQSLPGAGFKRYALLVRRQFEAVCRDSVALVKRDMALGVAPPSFASNLIEEMENGTVERCRDEVVGIVGGTLYGGGVDTTYSTVLVFILFACLHPQIQDRAFDEVKRVVGLDRLPIIEDRDNMPYVMAVVQEVLRYHPIAPLGIPRRAARDSVIAGYHIPKDSIIIPNAWAITRQNDGSGYPSEEFHPERFLSASPPQAPGSYVFGVGRRACMGQTVAENFLFMMISSLLASYSILPPLDDDGCEVLPIPRFTNSALTRPEPFLCRFVPRNQELLTRLVPHLD